MIQTCEHHRKVSNIDGPSNPSSILLTLLRTLPFYDLKITILSFNFFADKVLRLETSASKYNFFGSWLDIY